MVTNNVGQNTTNTISHVNPDHCGSVGSVLGIVASAAGTSTVVAHKNCERLPFVG